MKNYDKFYCVRFSYCLGLLPNLLQINLNLISPSYSFHLQTNPRKNQQLFSPSPQKAINSKCQLFILLVFFYNPSKGTQENLQQPIDPSPPTKPTSPPPPTDETSPISTISNIIMLLQRRKKTQASIQIQTHSQKQTP